MFFKGFNISIYLPLYLTIYLSAQGSLERKKFVRKIFKCVYISLLIITKLFLKYESLLLFKLNQLMVLIGMKPAHVDHESTFKIFLAKLFLARCTCALFIYLSIYLSIYLPIQVRACPNPLGGIYYVYYLVNARIGCNWGYCALGSPSQAINQSMLINYLSTINQLSINQLK